MSLRIFSRCTTITLLCASIAIFLLYFVAEFRAVVGQRAVLLAAVAIPAPPAPLPRPRIAPLESLHPFPSFTATRSAASPAVSPSAECTALSRKPRFIRVSNDRGGGIVQLSEIEALDVAGANVARGKPCSAKSTLEKFRCENVLDGARGGAFYASSGADRGEFVEADLGAEVQLAEVAVYNRDDHIERLAGQHLELLDDQRAAIVTFPLLGIPGGQSFDVRNIACPSQTPTSTPTRTQARTWTSTATASQSVGASPPEAARADALLRQRWTEFRRCLSVAQSPCASDTEREIANEPPPYDELEAHYRDLLAATASMRDFQPHNWAGYAGPWIENDFIAWAARANFSVFDLFYPLVPLFVQTVDACLLGCCASMMGYAAPDSTANDALLALVRTGLRRDVIYVVIAQADAGLCFLPPNEDCAARNILVLSSGGWGNVALPLIKGVVAADDFGGAPPPDAGTAAAYTRSTLISSTASDNSHSMRAGVRAALAAALPLPGQFRHFYGGPEWKGVVHDSVLSLSPRGYGRTSFRMSELVQMGIPQLYVYSDVPWAPYWDPKRPEGRPGRTDVWGAGGLGFVSNPEGLGAVVDGLCAAMLPAAAAASAQDAEKACPGGIPVGPPFTVHRGSRIDRMAARAKELAASHFTTAGVLQRILEFVATPWDADLLCVPRPAAHT